MSATFFEGVSIIELHERDLEALKRRAEGAPLRRSRLCLHRDVGEQVHEMVIAFCRDSYVRPHRHTDKSESFHVIEGELTVVFFDDRGEVTRLVAMAPQASGGAFLYRLNAPLWHTVVPEAEFVMLHETTSGPFVPEEREFAPWAPDEADEEGVRAFMDRMRTLRKDGG